MESFNPCWQPPHPARQPGGDRASKFCAAQNEFKFSVNSQQVILSSMFCSGNLARAQLLEDSDDENEDLGQVQDMHFALWVSEDCAGTSNLTTYRTWFHFALLGARAGQTVHFTVMNSNKQNGLYSHDHRPCFVSLPKQRSWQRLPIPVVSHVMVEGQMQVTFKHKILRSDEEQRFAFCFPYSYEETQAKLGYICGFFCRPEDVPQRNVEDEPAQKKSSWTSQIYFHRELLARSLDGRRMDLITITSSRDVEHCERELVVEGVFPNHGDGTAESGMGSGGTGMPSHKFKDRPVVLISARVHPGETPASWVFEGVLRMLLENPKKDPRAAALRDNFTFKLIPNLNPDGVARGHYRADNNGTNLNRRYADPDKDTEPTVWSAKQLALHYHKEGRLVMYLDLHAHASKRGVFMYGNMCESLHQQIENMLYVKLITINSQYLDFDACNFTEKNMKAKDKRDKGVSKEGSGRVAIYYATNKLLAHSYTLECNYNTGRTLNALPEASNDRGRAPPAKPSSSSCPKYTPAVFMDVAQGCLSALLDMFDKNPWSRLPRSRFHTLDNIRLTLFNRLRHSAPYREEAKAFKVKSKKNSRVSKRSKDAGRLSNQVGRRQPSSGSDKQINIEKARQRAYAASRAAAQRAAAQAQRDEKEKTTVAAARRALQRNSHTVQLPAANVSMPFSTAHNTNVYPARNPKPMGARGSKIGVPGAKPHGKQLPRAARKITAPGGYMMKRGKTNSIE